MRLHHTVHDTAPRCFGRHRPLQGTIPLFMLLLLELGGAAAHAGGVVAPNSSAVPIATSSESDPDPWTEAFLEYLRRLNDQLGGSAPLTSASVKEAMAQVQTSFESQGLPTPLTSAQIDEALDLINSMEDMLKAAPAGTDTQYLASVLEEVRAAYQSV